MLQLAILDSKLSIRLKINLTLSMKSSRGYYSSYTEGVGLTLNLEEVLYQKGWDTVGEPRRREGQAWQSEQYGFWIGGGYRTTRQAGLD